MVSAVDSETERNGFVSGSGRAKFEGDALLPGSADVKEEKDNLDVGDEDDVAVRSEAGPSIFSSFGADGKVHEANAAKCSGIQPCRDSLMLAASGCILRIKRMNLQTSMKGSVLLCGAYTECRSLKHA